MHLTLQFFCFLHPTSWNSYIPLQVVIHSIAWEFHAPLHMLLTLHFMSFSHSTSHDSYTPLHTFLTFHFTCFTTESNQQFGLFSCSNVLQVIAATRTRYVAAEVSQPQQHHRHEMVDNKTFQTLYSWRCRVSVLHLRWQHMIRHRCFMCKWCIRPKPRKYNDTSANEDNSFRNHIR